MARAPSASDRHGVAVSLSALEEKADGAAARVTHSLRDAGYVIITLPSSVAQTIQQSIASLKSALQAHREAETKGWVTPNSSKREPIRFGISSYRTRTQFRMLRHAPAEGELEATASSATSILQRCAAAVLDAVEGSLHTFQGKFILASLIASVNVPGAIDLRNGEFHTQLQTLQERQILPLFMMTKVQWRTFSSTRHLRIACLSRLRKYKGMAFGALLHVPLTRYAPFLAAKTVCICVP